MLYYHIVLVTIMIDISNSWLNESILTLNSTNSYTDESQDQHGTISTETTVELNKLTE